MFMSILNGHDVEEVLSCYFVGEDEDMNKLVNLIDRMNRKGEITKDTTDIILRALDY